MQGYSKILAERFPKRKTEEEKKAFSQVIYDTPRSPITLHRAPLWLLERAKDVE